METILGPTDGVELPREALERDDLDTDLQVIEDIVNTTRRDSYLSSYNFQAKSGEENSLELQWDQLDISDIVQRLNCDANIGLLATEAENRLSIHGLNELKKAKRPHFCFLFLLQLLNLIIILLIMGALASLIVNAISDGRTDPTSYVEGITVFVVVLLNATIGAYTENSAAGALEALSKLAQPSATVVRGGKDTVVRSNQLVPGDLILLATGDVVPADIRIIEADDLKVNEMLLTGESEDVLKFARMKQKKNPHLESETLTPENMAFASCMVTNGKAKALVVETGMNTRIGKIAQLLSNSDPKSASRKSNCCSPLSNRSSTQTPLQKSLQRLSMYIGIAAIVGCTLILIIGIVLQVQDLADPSQPGWLYMILVAVTLAVAAIPEGIPLCVTISLSTGCSDMVKKNVLVRRIAAVETLGCASVICTDKTGTLTEGKMTMVKLWSGGIDYDISGKGFNPTIGKITYQSNGADASSSIGVLRTLACGLICSNATIKEEMSENGEEKQWVPYGNSSEAPIVVAAAKVGLYSHDFERKLPRLYEVPFSSSRKMMLTACSIEGNRDFAISQLSPFFVSEEDHYFCSVKGAPNYIIDICDSWLNADGQVDVFDDGLRKTAIEKVNALSSEALRVLAIAGRALTELPFDPKDKDLTLTTDQKFDSLVHRPGLVLLGFVASIDPERDGVAQAVLDAQSGHIRVVMITGDYLPTAVAIANKVNIMQSTDDIDACALDCSGLRPEGEYMDSECIDHLTRTTKVFARAKPEDKLEIVKSLQRQGLVCAMTGDGVNDAPALKRADIGVAMGIQGTEVAKGASDMILIDDNFVSIVTAVEKGRVIYAGIQKFVSFILSVHLAEVVQIFLCIIAQLPIMRTPLQILYLILATDLAPSIALGMERAAPGILLEWPRPKVQPIILSWMWWGIVANAMILTITTMSVYIWGLSFYLENTFAVNDILAKINHQQNCTIPGAYAAINSETCVIVKLDLARTAAYVSLVWSESIRAYTSRSFNKPVWVDLCGNRVMQIGIFWSQVGFYCVTFIPGLSDVVFNLRGYQIGGEGWLAATIGAITTLAMCETYKYLTLPCITAQKQSTLEKILKSEQKRINDQIQASQKKVPEDAA